jgi:predicted kinase
MSSEKCNADLRQKVKDAVYGSDEDRERWANQLKKEGVSNTLISGTADQRKEWAKAFSKKSGWQHESRNSTSSRTPSDEAV